MTTFDRHIIFRLLIGFFTLIVVLIVFFVALHYVEYMDDFYDRGAKTSEVFLTYYPSYIPEIIKLISPLALFLSAIFLTGRLAQELQLTALFSSSVSLYRLMRPYLLVAVCWSVFMFWFNGWVIPEKNRVRIDFEMQYFKETAGRRADLNNLHIQNTPESIIAVGYFDKRAQIAYRVSMQRFDDRRRLVDRADARNMSWVDSLQVWRVVDMVQRHFDPEGEEHRMEVARMDTILNVFPRDLARTERDTERLTITEASEYVDALYRSGASNIGRPLVEYYAKYAYPFASLILILVAVPLAAVRRRGGQAMQLGLGLAIAFVYLALQKLTEPFGYAGDLDPLVTVLIPHVTFFVFGMFLIYRVRT